MAALRQRKGSRGKEPPLATDFQRPPKTPCCPDHHTESSRLHAIVWTSIGWSVSVGLGLLCCIYVATLHENDLWFSNIKPIVWTSIGWSVSVGLGLLCCIYVATLHENDLWFSNIKEVEREISFRTECGLYYSYYKQMLQAPSIGQGLWDLVHDNLTESKRTINLLQRMNIYQEVFLSVLYRVLPIQAYLEPIYFYIYTVFSLQAVYVIAVYLTAWLLSGTWLAGVLAAVWYILNRVDTTRVEFTISLRENWSMPFLALQPGLKTGGGLLARLGRLLLHTALVLGLTATVNYVTKRFKDFDASLYLCEDAFGPLPLDTLERLGGTLLLYPYLLTVGGLVAVLAAVALRNLSTVRYFLF
ncbi:hypothetical protein CRUP_005342 [Coryphaenoides rupestris]|nr:hypothetical protein CRUP_005342 [Coryphaenoides rupestris]